MDKKLASVSWQVESVGNVNFKFFQLSWDLHLLLFPWELHSFMSLIKLLQFQVMSRLQYLFWESSGDQELVAK